MNFGAAANPLSSPRTHIPAALLLQVRINLGLGNLPRVAVLQEGRPSFVTLPPHGQAPGDRGNEDRCQDGVEPAGDSRRAQPAPATPGPAHRPPGRAPLRSLLR